jgi:hypothetical protein
MTHLDKTRFDVLENLAVNKFGGISNAEKGVLELSAVTGEHIATSSRDRPDVRAAFLRWLLTDKQAFAQIAPLGLQVENVTIPTVLDLDSCNVPFPLQFRYCTFRNDLSLQYAKLPSLVLSHCTTQGMVLLNGAQIDNDFDCSCTHLLPVCNPSQPRVAPPPCDYPQPLSRGIGLDCLALNAEGARTGGSFILENVQSVGSIQLSGIQIGAHLDCRGATLNARGEALAAEAARITINVGLNQGFSCTGIIRFTNAQIGGDLNCSGGKISKLQCDRMRISGDIVWSGVRRVDTTELDLYGATVARLHDDRSSWPRDGKLHLDGFVYQDLVLHREPPSPEMIAQYKLVEPVTPLSARDRVDWLKLQPKGEIDRKQPWMQLALVLEANGNSNEARWVKYQFNRLQAQKTRIAFLTYPYDRLEEQPLWVLIFILLLWLFGSVVFWRAKRMGAMIPKGRNAETGKCRDAEAEEGSDQIVPFNPAMYTLENVLPVVKLGQDDVWMPNPRSERHTWFPDRAGLKWTRWLPGLNYSWLASLRWALILLGWALAIILGAAISGHFKS